jgi:hypothetical protein
MMCAFFSCSYWCWSAQAEEAEHSEHDDDEADEIDDAVHGRSP